ncbi:MAG: glycosyltransferase [Bacteroidales bacterium]|nr:glycosyltransferase [Bacteroidales bacterium]
MKLSIVIVNYNVEHFLEQALLSVYKALKNIEAEVFVVDNNSVDHSLEMLAEKFPQVRVIANKENVGFARANNQAIRESTGEYVLLLNPDTVVEEDTFDKCIAFMDATPDAGGLGVKMVNGQGEFLPESKRGIPFPAVAFYKLFGLSKIFPQSHKFGSYHLTYLDNDEINAVEVLSGAFMLMRKKTLDEVGLLDEDYFMYGEDIDLSYRILKGGYKNYYFPKTRIIHYKGESTKKGSLNYVHVFYKAMQIFAQKHFSKNNAKLFNALINCAIWFRASLAALKRILSRLLLPFADFALSFAGLFGLATYWNRVVMAGRHSAFPSYYFYWVLPLYILVWILAVWACKGYKHPLKTARANRGVVLGTVAILLVYALLPETLRFSRAVLLLGAMWSLISVNLLRAIAKRLPKKFGGPDQTATRRVVVVGDVDEASRVLSIVRMMDNKCDFWGIVTIREAPTNDNRIIGRISQIQDLLTLYRVNEVIFCSRDLSSEQIIDQMCQLQSSQLEFKIAPEDSVAVIGSSSIFSTETSYTLDVHVITQKRNRICKRIFDIVSSLLLLLFFVVDIWFVKQKNGFIRNIFQVLSGKKSWVGMSNSYSDGALAQLKPGVLHPTDAFKNYQFSEDMLATSDRLYARDYTVKTDLVTIWRGFSHLGRA